MSTRSAIITKTETGYAGIYCHFDGYEEGIGSILEEYYKDQDKVDRLIDLGDISSLGGRVEPIGSHSYDDREEGTTVAYHRDRGEGKSPAKIGASIESVAKQIGHNGYVYVFEDGTWSVNGRRLSDVLAEIKETA